MDECIFCKIVKREIPASIVYEDDVSLAFLDIKPVNPGHTLLIPKEHYKNLYEMPDELLSKTGPNTKKIAIAVKRATEADGINIGMNNDPAAGQLVFHQNTHIIPRFSNDGHKHWKGRLYKEGEEQVIAEKIKSVL